MIVVPLITTPYLTRVIGAEGIGTYAFNYAIVSYFILFIKLGIDNYGNRAVAEKRNNSEELNKVFSELIYLQFFLGAIATCVYLVYAGWLSTEKRYAFLFIITVLATCIDINWFLYGMEEFKVISIRNAGIKLISTALIFAFVKNSNHIFLYCLIMNFCTLISQIIAWPLVLRKTKLVLVAPRDVIKHIKPNMVIFMSLVSVSIFKTMDKIMLGLLTPDNLEVGYYESAERIIHIPNTLVVSLGTVMMPRITNMIASKDDNYKKYIFVSMVFSMAIASSMSFGIMGVSKEFVPVYYGPGFEKCASLYLILLPCCIFMSFATVIRTQFLMPNHRDKAMLIASVSGAGLNLIVNWILIPMWGSIGAAIATLASEAVVCIFQILAVKKGELNIRKLFGYSIQFVILGIIMFVIVFFLKLSAVQSVVLQILIKVIVGALVFIGGGIILLAIGQKQKDEEMIIVMNQMKTMISRMMRRYKVE